jgi:catechol 2,3-dioxygenase-like lactoylglutathione lyase family enzyme
LHQTRPAGRFTLPRAAAGAKLARQVGPAAGPAASVSAMRRPSPLDRVLETILYVDDLDAAERFYGGALGLELDSRKEGVFAFFRVGPGMLLLFEPSAARTSRGVPAHGAAGPGHACFAAPEAELEAWRASLATAGVAIEHEQAWPRGGRSLYFRDPAGNSLEIATPRIWGLPEVGGT